MKASLFAEAEDEEESDMFQERLAMKVSAEVSSPRHPGAQGRPSGRKHSSVLLVFSFSPFFLLHWVSVNHSKRLDFCVSTVGGLLQTRFTSGLLLSHLSDSPRPPPPPLFPPRASPAAVESPRLSQWAGPGASSFMLPPRAPEVSIRTVGVRRLGGPVPLKESVTQGKVSAFSTVTTDKKKTPYDQWPSHACLL